MERTAVQRGWSVARCVVSSIRPISTATARQQQEGSSRAKYDMRNGGGEAAKERVE